MKENWIIKSLKDKGIKLTHIRHSISVWISNHKGVFSAKELIKELPELDSVSVYRTLDLFSELDIIHPVLTSHGEIHFEKHEGKHHHHAVCTKCEKTACVDYCGVPKINNIKGFKKIHHTLVFTGLCLNCN